MWENSPNSNPIPEWERRGSLWNRNLPEKLSQRHWTLKIRKRFPFHSSSPTLIFTFSGKVNWMTLYLSKSKLCFQLTAEPSTMVGPWPETEEEFWFGKALLGPGVWWEGSPGIRNRNSIVKKILPLSWSSLLPCGKGRCGGRHLHPGFECYSPGWVKALAAWAQRDAQLRLMGAGMLPRGSVWAELWSTSRHLPGKGSKDRNKEGIQGTEISTMREYRAFELQEGGRQEGSSNRERREASRVRWTPQWGRRGRSVGLLVFWHDPSCISENKLSAVWRKHWKLARLEVGRRIKRMLFGRNDVTWTWWR